MIRVLVVLLALGAGSGSPALAQAVASSAGQTARVLSGEHGDFTRLVIEFPGDADWNLGRTATGYAFAGAAGVQPDYDLTTVWDRIPRSRMQSLRVDPVGGALQIDLACPCHVVAFEYLDKAVVIDIRNGPAPPGSAFEAPISLSAPAAVVTAPRDARPQGSPPDAFDWLDLPLAHAGRPSTLDLSLPSTIRNEGLDPLFDELLRQVSRGAADGVVDMKLPGKPDSPAADGNLKLAQARISLGELPGLVILDGTGDPEDRPPDSAACLSDESLALADWGGGRPALDLLAEARGGLFGEFDTADPDAVLLSVKLHLYLGFGAEALQYAALLPGTDDTAELAPLLSMARLIEDGTDPATPFATMLTCDGSAALWAALAHSRLPPTTEMNTDAIVRGFQALPPHLRRHLGPPLVDRLLERDADAARMVRDAMERTPEVSKGTVALLDAKAELQAKRPEAAMVHAEVALAEGGSPQESLIALVEAHVRSSLPLSPDVAEALGALQQESGPETSREEIQRALVLALALSGQVDEAFALVDPVAPASADLWRVVSERAEDGALLAHAVRPADAPVPAVAPDVALGLASRLAGLGFAEAALAWLGPVGPGDPAPRREVAAKAELARGDARRVLLLLAGLDGPEVIAMRVAAQTQLGAFAAARQTLEGSGQTEAAARLATWQEDWAGLQAEGEDTWSVAAAFAEEAPPSAPGPLARGEALLADSTAARAAIGALLAETPTP